MPLSDADKREILELIKVSLAPAVKTAVEEQLGEVPATGALDVRRLGAALAKGGPKVPPVAAEQCCNGCD